MNDHSKTLELLKRFIAIESVSADPKRRSGISSAVEFIKKELSTIGFEVKIVEDDGRPPIVYAEKIVSPDSLTIGLYAHYDVQPEDPVHEWKTPPFTLTQQDGKLLGRGVADDKGHLIQIIAALQEIVQNNGLSNNIICLFEGEEETGSPTFEKYVVSLKEKLEQADVFYILDMGMYVKGVPQIFYGLRGLVYFELEITTGTRDLHSGSYGNKVLNPAQVAAELFASMKDLKTHKVLIPGFYDDILEQNDREVKQLLEIARSDEDELEESGTFTLTSVGDMHSFLSTKILPSLDINGFVSGYTGQGAKTVIASKAVVKFSCRLVEKQDPQKMVQAVRSFIEKSLPDGAKHELRVFSADPSFYTATDNVFVEQTSQILKSVFHEDVIFNRSGGSIAAAEILQRLIQKPVILTGFILPDSNLHSPNENYDEDMFWKGIDVLKKIFTELRWS